MVKFYKLAGYLSNVASVIKELAHECTKQKLADVIRREKTKSVLQRLGYLLEKTGHEKLAQTVETELKTKRNIEYIPLNPEFPSIKGRKNNLWKLILNNHFILKWNKARSNMTSSYTDLKPLITFNSQNEVYLQRFTY